MRWRITMGFEVVPRYIRIAYNISADGLARWIQYECDRWMYNRGMRPVELPELWEKWEQEWGKRTEIPSLNTPQLLMEIMNFYQTNPMGVVERRSEILRLSRILHEHGIRTEFIELPNKEAFA